MQVDVVELAKWIGALSVIGGILIAVFKFVLNSKKNDAEIRKVKKEQTLICYALTACLNGLHQLGANGEVTVALEKMSKHLNQAAHDDE